MPTRDRPPVSLRILHWNICHGGGTRRTPEIALELLQRAPDVVVLTEFRTTTGGQLAGVLYDHGWVHALTSAPAPGVNGILIASRTPIERGDPPPVHDAPRWADAVLSELGLRLTAVHVPHAMRSDAREIARKARFFEALVASAQRHRRTPHLFVGDFNTARRGIDGDGAISTLSQQLGRLASLGYRDPVHSGCVSARSSTWWSHAGRGFRLDQTLASGPLTGAVVGVRTFASVRDRGLSDHASVEIELCFGGSFSPLPS